MICEVCITDSWEPCPPETSNAVQDPETGGWMVCGMCRLEERVRALVSLLEEWQRTPFFEKREDWERWVGGFGKRVQEGISG